MRKHITSLISICLLLLVVGNFSQLTAQPPKDFAIMASAEVEKGLQATITLSWPSNPDYSQISIWRKTKAETYWGNSIARIEGEILSYTDNNVEVGTAYEYQLIADAEADNGSKYSATGYIYAGIEVPAKEAYGKVLLLVDQTIAGPLEMEIGRLMDDMRAEGWAVVRKDVPRTEDFDGAAVKNIKNIIYSVKDSSGGTLNTVFLLGRIAVPYSGDMYPDGHADHKGAWPADLYYGHMNESVWSDTYIYTVNQQRPRNENLPGDGKFDPSRIEFNDVYLRVGRVDLYDMPAFHDEQWAQPEIELYRRYLNKDHDYRTGKITYEMRGLIDDNTKGYPEKFGSGGWRNFGALFGAGNVEEVDWLTTLETDSYLWSYGCGGGNFTGAGGVGNTNKFASQPLNSIFTTLFGSYFGDWDVTNNFLRAGLCSEPSILTCAWSGRPQWYFHHMGLGEPIGYSTVLSQNNMTTYIPYKRDYYYNAYGNQKVHTALMGDPTLRMYMNTVDSPKNLSAVQPGGGVVELNWEAPEIDGIFFFDVFRAEFDESGSKYGGDWVKVNQLPLSEISLTDNYSYEGTLLYMVRTIKLQETNSGSFFNHSLGLIQDLVVTDVENGDFDFAFTAAPNPAVSYSNITLAVPYDGVVDVAIFDMRGNRIRELASRHLASGSHSFSWGLTGESGAKVSPGVYFVRVSAKGIRQVVKIIVMP